MYQQFILQAFKQLFTGAIIVILISILFVGYIVWNEYSDNQKTKESEKQVEIAQLQKQAQLKGEILLLNQIYSLAKDNGEVRISPFLFDAEGKFIMENGQPKRGEEIKLIQASNTISQ